MKKKLTKDDVDCLIRGKPTRSKVGSRNISHRLRAYEKLKLKLAEKRGFLVIDSKTRDALKNSWFLLCLANGIGCDIREGPNVQNKNIKNSFCKV
jgi:hypothetical protein